MNYNRVPKVRDAAMQELQFDAAAGLLPGQQEGIIPPEIANQLPGGAFPGDIGPGGLRGPPGGGMMGPPGGGMMGPPGGGMMGPPGGGMMGPPGGGMMGPSGGGMMGPPGGGMMGPPGGGMMGPPGGGMMGPNPGGMLEPPTSIGKIFTHDLCDCCSDGTVCCCVTFCGSCYLAYLSSKMKENPCLCLCLSPQMALTMLRFKFRLKENIDGDALEDCCISCCAFPCAMCQLARERKGPNLSPKIRGMGSMPNPGMMDHANGMPPMPMGMPHQLKALPPAGMMPGGGPPIMTQPPGRGMMPMGQMPGNRF